MDFDMILLTALVPSILLLLIMCLLSCLRCRRHPTVARSSANIYTVPTNYNTVTANPQMPGVHSAPSRPNGHNRISSVGDRFAVPLDLLPPNFDFNAPGVERKDGYVLIKDLKALETSHRDEYQKQSPYNPNFS